MVVVVVGRPKQRRGRSKADTPLTTTPLSRLWTAALHRSFVDADGELGVEATPGTIFARLRPLEPLLTEDDVYGHLQTHRKHAAAAAAAGGGAIGERSRAQ